MNPYTTRKKILEKKQVWAARKKKFVRNHPRTPEEAEANLRKLFLRYSKSTDKLGVPLLNESANKILGNVILHLKCIQEISIQSRILEKAKNERMKISLLKL